MKIYLAGTAPWKSEGLYDEAIKQYRPYILESYFYADADTERLLPYFGDFLLDSGAFTFMQNKYTETNWNAYIERYAAFIVRNNVQKYFELDIDSVVGYEKVLEYRKTLERLTGRPCIPVWHISRGLEDYKETVKQYSYIALGGIACMQKSSNAYKEYHKRFPQLLKMAHENNCMVHGLGFTALTKLEKYRFDSVDSTAWTTGNRFGYAYRFDGRNMLKINKPKGTRAKGRKLALHNYIEWIKFQKYAETHL